MSDLARTALTVAMIVKDEAHHMNACLQSVHDWADEILIIDAGSQDNTLEIAKGYAKVRVLEHHDWRGFGPQRQVGQKHVRTPWVFWLDADERVTPELAQAIQKAIRQGHDNVVYSVNRLSWVFGRFIRHSGWYPDRVLRLYPTALTTYSDAPVHESVVIPPGAQTQPLGADLLHYTYRDLQHYLVKSAHYAHLWAQQKRAQGKQASISKGLIHGLGCFLKMYVIKAGFLDGRAGLLLALLSAHSTFAKYANLWLLNQSQQDTQAAKEKPAPPN